MKDHKTKVLVVDDSSVVRALLTHILNSDPTIQVTGSLSNGQEAVAWLKDHSVHVVVMDIDMPMMDGFEATRNIMETAPVPIVICSASTDPRETVTIFRSMEAGAVACIEKPLGREHANFQAMAARLIETVKLMSEVKVVRRWSKSRKEGTPSASPRCAAPTAGAIEVIGIGASTGGPPVLQTILAGLPKEFSVPLLVVQHIAPGFLPGLVEWLNQTTGVKVLIATYGALPQPGHVYLAPDDFHMGVRAGGEIILTKEERESSLRPSVGQLFRSIADVHGPNAIGVLLTGMGKDGAADLKRMKDRGATTIVQNRESSVVFGMPGEAVALDAATYVLPPERIAQTLEGTIRQRLSQKGDLS